ncbi:hypothetical protein CROQUDRAFT_661631 [Cronartium quercuum f. sp. fusiforme G11]|uniref:Uncharacterized protein n=1 Tax=Cronartium quercuum f. sp. fusiforme G11 TaxID=708437 RepID=A0A9P6T8L7_9BASI|nr:hypothetical protein CROQUDRAFT_661631 [Cronartium quercuum f. sp. fusiforme G11]
MRILGNSKCDSHVCACVHSAPWPPDTSAKRTPTDEPLPTLVPSLPVNLPNPLTSSHP